MGHRTKAVMVRLTEQEHKRLSAAAERNGATLAAYLRMVSFSDTGAPQCTPPQELTGRTQCFDF